MFLSEIDISTGKLNKPNSRFLKLMTKLPSRDEIWHIDGILTVGTVPVLCSLRPYMRGIHRGMYTAYIYSIVHTYITNLWRVFGVVYRKCAHRATSAGRERHGGEFSWCGKNVLPVYVYVQPACSSCDLLGCK